jgi:NAD(P)-dependent dehydrogenase (short-subunit alcohol dehydrogenase family)
MHSNVAMSRFTDKIVIITGGTSGIGLAAARRFINSGAKEAIPVYVPVRSV